MLRIRGTMYLGRGITDTGSDLEDMDDDGEGGHDDSQDGAARYESQGNVLLLLNNDQRKAQQQQHLEYPTLLEKILSGTSPGPNQHIVSKGLCSGGSVEMLEAAERAAAAGGGGLPLTPPPSVSGESNARSTPPEVAGYTAADCDDHPMDLTVRSHQEAAAAAARQQQHLKFVATPKSSPVILEQVSPTWKAPAPSSELFYYKQEVKAEDSQQEETALDSAERIAVNALLALGKAH